MTNMLWQYAPLNERMAVYGHYTEWENKTGKQIYDSFEDFDEHHRDMNYFFVVNYWMELDA